MQVTFQFFQRRGGKGGRERKGKRESFPPGSFP